MIEHPQDLSRLCIHTITTKPWSLKKAVEEYSAVGIGGITIWRDSAKAHPDGLPSAGEMCRSSGLEIVSYVRGGFFPATSCAARQAAVDDNLKVLDEAAELGAPLVVLVCGAVPGMCLAQARGQIEQGLEAILPHAAERGIRLGIEPLHPMYSDCRSAINTLTQANDLAISMQSDWLGVTVDVYHMWWDERLEKEIFRCGDAGKLFSFHICDWKNEPQDLLNDRGLMGEGCINIPQIRAWVEAAGFTGFHEVEIFSNRYWALDQSAYLKQIISAYLTHS